MNLIDTYTGDKARSEALNPIGPNFCPDTVAMTETLEVHGSSFDESGPDYCEFHAFDASGHLIGSRRVEGY